ncbi:glycoside hydrolase family 16 protein [Sphingomonas ginkgonis]|uniref:Glycoside hydrolase family 16 protein n=1 Tax=Sphingomonas ginkgonis TaxID=2315330 RepID=A0A429VBL2_9SPHN|nr:glycoside hydrolase family 16 protein [Sphingomonas ginkgonis]RST31247.1 glycoside hydrolase family 16 protein [Sphingomonas ginkgonis]
MSLLTLFADLVSRGAEYRVSGPMERPAAARMVWHDEFAWGRLDPGEWSFDTSRNKAGWYNGERQYYAADRAANLRVADGQLTIEARRERLDPARFPDWGGQDYSSSKIISRRAWRYGFFEVRAVLPCARGSWPAIWMLPKGVRRWPDDGEIDIMEQVGAEPNLVYATLHSGRYNHRLGTQRGAQQPVPTSCTAAHRYQLDWRPDAITIGIDDRAVMRVRRKPGDGQPEWPFDRPFQLILNLAVGGDWAGAKGIDDAAFPQRMRVDYVRVWQSPTERRSR